MLPPIPAGGEPLKKSRPTYFQNYNNFSKRTAKSFKCIHRGRHLSRPGATPYNQVKSLLGQDLTRAQTRATGFGFRKPDQTLPDRCVMFKELTTDIPGFRLPTRLPGAWADREFMLNAVLTVGDKANSHKSQAGNNPPTHYQQGGGKKDRVVFVLWGNYARKEKVYYRSTIES